MSAKNPASALRIGTIGAAIIFHHRLIWTEHQHAGDSSPNIASGRTLRRRRWYHYRTQSPSITPEAKPIRDIAKSGETGVATVMISGLSVGLKSVAIHASYSRCHHLCLLRVRRPATELASLPSACSARLASLWPSTPTDPVADNAGGIAEMSRHGA